MIIVSTHKKFYRLRSLTPHKWFCLWKFRCENAPHREGPNMKKAIEIIAKAGLGPDASTYDVAEELDIY